MITNGVEGYISNSMCLRASCPWKMYFGAKNLRSRPSPFRHGKGLGQTCFSLCGINCPRSRFFIL